MSEATIGQQPSQPLPDEAATVSEAEAGDKVFAIEEEETHAGDQVALSADEVVAKEGATNDQQEESKESKYQTYEEFDAKAVAVVGAGRALVEQVKSGVDVSKPIQDQILEQVATINSLLETNFAQHDKKGTYPDLIELKTDLIQIKLDVLIQRLQDTIKKRSTKQDFAEQDSAQPVDDATALETEQDLDQQIDAIALELAALVSESSQSQEELEEKITNLKEKILARLEGENVEGVKESFDKKASGSDQGTENSDTIDSELEDYEENEVDPEKKEQIRAVRQTLKILGYGAVFLGVTVRTFFDKKAIDLAAFLAFIRNPTGGAGGGYEFRYSGEKGETIPHHIFKQKFSNYRDVGKALSGSADRLSESSSLFRTWKTKDNNEAELRSLKDSVDAVKTHNLLVSLHETVLADNISGSSDRWDEFSKEFTSALFGGDVVMEDESIQFLKEHFENEGEKLRQFWKIGATQEISPDTSSEVAGEDQNKETEGDEVNTNTLSQTTAEPEQNGSEASGS